MFYFLVTLHEIAEAKKAAEALAAAGESEEEEAWDESDVASTSSGKRKKPAFRGRFKRFKRGGSR